MASTVFERQRPPARIVEDSLADTKLSCFWIDDVADTAPHYPALTGDTLVDFVIVGGGFAGLWTAIKLKTEHPDRTVLLIEAKRIGWAASGRNGGFCEASITHGEANAGSRWPDEAEGLARLGYENLDAIERFIADHGLDVDFERSGELSVANEPYQLNDLGESSEDHVVLDAELGMLLSAFRPRIEEQLQKNFDHYFS